MSEYITEDDITIDMVAPVLVDKLLSILVPKVSISKKAKKIQPVAADSAAPSTDSTVDSKEQIRRPTQEKQKVTVKKKPRKSSKVVGLSSYVIMLVCVISYINFLILRKFYPSKSTPQVSKNGYLK